MSGNPFAPGSSVKPIGSSSDLQRPSNLTEDNKIDGQIKTDPFKQSIPQGPVDPFAASNIQPVPEEETRHRKRPSFPEAPNPVEEYSFAELKPTQAGIPSRRTTFSSDAGSLNSTRLGNTGDGFPVNFSSNAPVQNPDRFQPYPQNPLYNNSSAPVSYNNTPRNQYQPPNNPQTPNPSFRGYTYAQPLNTSSIQPRSSSHQPGISGIYNQGSTGGNFRNEGSLGEVAQNMQSIDPFANLSGLTGVSAQRQNPEPKPSWDSSTAPQPRQNPHMSQQISNNNSQLQNQQSNQIYSSPHISQPQEQSFAPRHGEIPSYQNQSASSYDQNYGRPGYNSLPQNYGPQQGYPGHFQQSVQAPGNEGENLRGNALTRPFYPAGDSRGQQPQFDNKHFDFATLDILRARRKSIEEEAKKDKQKPMRPNTDGWAQSWASFDQEQPSAKGPVSELRNSEQIHPQFQPPSQSNPPNSSEIQNQPDFVDTAIKVSEPSQMPLPETGHPVVQNLAQPQINTVSQQSKQNLPWALAPPKNDPLKPRTQTEGGFSRGQNQVLTGQNSDVSGQMSNLRVSERPEPWKNLSESDAEIARKLQEQWDNEDANPSQSNSKPTFTALNRRSGVAGIPPPASEIAALRRTNTGNSEVQNRAQAFLNRVGGGQNEDEAMARRLQAEYDRENASSAKPRNFSHGAHPMESRNQPPSYGASTFQNSKPNLQDDEAYAHKLQEQEIKRSQSYGQGMGPSSQIPPQFNSPQNYGYPSPTFPAGDYPHGHHQQGYPGQNQYGGPPQYHNYPGQHHSHHPGQTYHSGNNQYQGGGYQNYTGPQNNASHGFPEPPSWQSGQRQNQGNQVVDDAELARQLQSQYDRESQDMQPRQNPRTQNPPTSSSQTSSSQQGGTSMPFWKRIDKLVAPDPNSLCKGCKQPVYSMFGGQYITAAGSKWHPDADCLRCDLCKEVIRETSFAIKDDKIYHHVCHKQAFHPKCCVCHDYLPKEGGNVVWTTDTFWKYKACKRHTGDGTHKCYACNRFQPEGEDWVTVSSEAEATRKLCLQCVGTIVVDTNDAQPLYNEVLSFYAQKGMALPTKPPLLLVEPSAMESAENREQRHHTLHRNPNAPVFHTRGLTLSMEYQSMRTVARQGRSIIPQCVTIPGSRHSEVTAILVLAGLPRLLAGSILAHECIHAWLRLTSSPKLSRHVEEGLCQLMAYLWLQSQNSPQGSYEERLQSYCEHQIRNERSYEYGDGFRSALDSLESSHMSAANFANSCKAKNQF